MTRRSQATTKKTRQRVRSSLIHDHDSRSVRDRARTHLAKLRHLRGLDRAGQGDGIRRVHVVVMRRAPADAEPSREASVITGRLQQVHVVHRHVLKPPPVAQRARLLMQRVSQLAIASARSKRREFSLRTTAPSSYITRLNLLNTDITLFAFVIRGEIVIGRRAPGILASGGLRGCVGPARLQRGMMMRVRVAADRFHLVRSYVIP